MTKFRGFGPEVRSWFEGLESDNSKQYFLASRELFEDAIRSQMQALLSELGEKFGGEVKMFRQNRDVRFSPDKSPYKTSTSGLVYGAGAAPLYASISARGLVAGTGYHEMARDQLARYRDQVSDSTHGPEVEKLVARAERAGLKLWGDSVATAPRGYPKDHERIALLRRKGLSLGATLDFGRGIGRTEGLDFVTQTRRAAAPVTGWLDERVGPSTMS